MKSHLFIISKIILLLLVSSLPAKDKEPRKKRGQRYSIEQAVSDRAQLHTIAFSGVAFLTGEFGASTFIPPGKVCDYFGFQYMRDIDAAQKGHNPMFLNRVVGNVLHILNPDQKQLFEDLAEEQAPELEKLARMRLPLIKAFHLEAERQEPGLSQKVVTEYVGGIFELDAALSIRRAEVMAEVYRSLTDEQKTYLSKMKFGDFDTWPDIDERGKKRKENKRGKSKLLNVAYMTYASEFFSWTAGNVEADVYFCPERHGTYFGGFYMKDMPAMGKRDYDISTSITGESGRHFVENILNPEQAKRITSILDKQRNAIMGTIELRREIAIELRKFLKNETPDTLKILDLGKQYGELDGYMSWLYAMAFAEVNRTLTKDQREALTKLRDLSGYDCAPYYIYSRGREDALHLKNVESTFFMSEDNQA
ncbi:MAG: hypothetical protein MI748_20910 [Opitutales bacterium]|nr:hypothetical protein [Opitutales bacterium]